MRGVLASVWARSWRERERDRGDMSPHRLHWVPRWAGGVCRVHLQTLIAAEPLQLQWGFLQLQARFCNCRHIRSFGVFAMERQHCSSSQVPICRCCNCKGGKRVRKSRRRGKSCNRALRGLLSLFPLPAANSQLASWCTAHSYTSCPLFSV